MPIRVLVVADSAAQAHHGIINAQPDLEVAGYAHGGMPAETDRLEVDVVTLDGKPIMDGLETLKRIMSDKHDQW